MQPLLAPGVYSHEEEPAPVTIPTQVQTVGAMVGLSEMGPMDGTPTTSVDFPDWQRQHGGYTSWNLASVASVKKFFEDGGQLLRFARTCHHSDPSDPNSKTSAKATKTIQTSALSAGSGSVLSTNAAPYNLEPGDTLVVGRDALGNATATFNAAVAERASGNAPFALSNNQNLTLSVNGGPVQTITFTTSMFVAIGAATAAEVAAAINGQLSGGYAAVDGSAVDIRTDRRGTAASLNITGGTANGALGYTTGAINGTGNVADIDAVTSAEIKTVVEAAVSGVTVTSESGYQRITSNTTGGSSSVQVQASSTADDELGFDNALHTGNAAGAVDTLRIDAKWDGSYGNELRVVIATATDGVAGHFNLTVQRNGVTIEAFANLSMLDTDPRFVETILNDVNTGSRYIAAVDLDAAASFPLDVPANGTHGPLSGGGDGLGSLDDNDFVGGSGVNGTVGLSCFDEVKPDLIGVPERATPVVHNAMVTWCVTVMDGKCFPIIEPPAGYSDSQIETYFTSTATLKGLSEHGSFYWPRIKVANPNKTVYGSSDQVTVPITGMVMGLCCRVDGLKVGGFFDQPAGAQANYLPRNVLGLENDAANKKSVRDRLAPLGINIIRHSGRRGPIMVDGSSVLLQTGNWPSVGQRRGISRVRKQIDLFMEVYVHRNITDDLIRDEKATIDAYLTALVGGGNLPSKVPSQVFVTDFGPGQNTAATKRAMQTRGRLLIATAYPNKFVVISIGPDNRAFEAELAAQVG